MTSFRKSFRYERPTLPNGNFLLNSLKSDFVSTSGHKSSPFTFVVPQSWLSIIVHRSERVKRKSYFFSKKFIHLLLFFLLGFGLGLIPLRREDAFNPLSFALLAKLETKENVAMEWNGFRTNLQATKVTGLRLESLITGEGSSPAVRTNHAVKKDGLDERLSAGQTLPSSLNDTAIWYQGLLPRKLLIAITPTFTGPLQAFYLTKLAQILKLVPPPLLWLVVETHEHSLETATLLKETGIVYRHIICHKKVTVKDRHDYLRNVALAHIQEHQLDGIVYFADEKNTYTLQLFEQLRQIKRFGAWLVGMLAHGKFRTTLYGPVCRGTTVIGWHTNDKKMRRFHADMSGFGFNSTMLWDTNSWKRPMMNPNHHLDIIGEAFQETTFLQELVEDESQMEGLPSGCTKVMVWRLHLKALEKSYPTSWRLEKNLDANIGLV